MQYTLIGIFLSILAIMLLAVGMGARYLEQQGRKRLSGMLRDPQANAGLVETSVLLASPDDGRNQLDRVLSSFAFPRKWEIQLQQAGLTWSVPQLLLAMFICGLAGGIIGSRLHLLIDPTLSIVGFAAVLATIPWQVVRHKRKVRMAKFEEEFPEALDFLARAMRSGHAFPVSLAMLSQESPEPLRGEFLKVYNEQNLGESINVVLVHLADRVPLVDVRFFVSAVLMQRETGGNLGEILTKLAYVIRERFRLKGQVRAASAHGRITATILTILPIATVALLSIIAPGYLPTMARDPDGKYLIIAAIAAQAVGYYFMRRIIDIKV